MINLDHLTLEQKKLVQNFVERLLAPSDDFDTFWKAYPRKVGKGNARKAWKKLNPPLEAVLKVLEFQKKDWDEIKYIPHPATWINGENWENEIRGKNKWSADEWERYINSGESGANTRSKELNETNKKIWIGLYQTGKIH